MPVGVGVGVVSGIWAVIGWAALTALCRGAGGEVLPCVRERRARSIAPSSIIPLLRPGRRR